jgi:hypothetical protein
MLMPKDLLGSRQSSTLQKNEILNSQKKHRERATCIWGCLLADDTKGIGNRRKNKEAGLYPNENHIHIYLCTMHHHRRKIVFGHVYVLGF